MKKIKIDTEALKRDLRPAADKAVKAGKKAAEKAIKKLARQNVIFEINTGAIARGSRTTPYPAPDVLARIREKGGRILFSSDCHNKDFLLCGRELAIAAAKNAGFKEYAVLEHDGFKTYLIK